MLCFYLALLENPEDEPLFETFYNKFYNVIYLVSKDHLKTKEAAEDCAHEVLMYFAKEFHNISHDFNDKKLCNYIRVVTKCMAIDIYRKERKHINNVVDIDLEDFYNIAARDFDIVDEITLKDAFNQIPEDYRFICYLKYVYNMSGEEIAKMLKISKPLVRKRCMLGMQFVRNYINGEENEQI